MLKEFKKKQIVGKAIRGAKKDAEFSTQVMKHDELVNKLSPKKKFYSNKKIEAEADKIFTKNRPDLALKDKTFPAYGSDSATPKYNREYKRTLAQVKKVRESMNK